MVQNPDRVVQAFEVSIDTTLATLPFNVVVMGPSLTDTSPPGTLRRGLIEAAQEYGTTVQPEHRGILKVSKKRLGAGHHLTAMEAHLVEVSDLVVLIPDSPGALCELGCFSVGKSARKFLILNNDAYPRSGSYVADGPIAAAAHNGAEIHYVDYGDFESCWRIVQVRIEKDRSAKGLRKIMNQD